MVCGINFGYSIADKNLEKSGALQTIEPASFFSHKNRNDTRFRNRVLTCLSSWELPFTREESNPFDCSVFQTNWLDTQSRTVTSDQPITNDLLVNESNGILNLLEIRRPSTII